MLKGNFCAVDTIAEAPSQAIDNLPVFLFGICSWVLEIHNRFWCGVRDQQSIVPRIPLSVN
jgi:hypothetical protein